MKILKDITKETKYTLSEEPTKKYERFKNSEDFKNQKDLYLSYNGKKIYEFNETCEDDRYNKNLLRIAIIERGKNNKKVNIELQYKIREEKYNLVLYSVNSYEEAIKILNETSL